jgi:hypothetical protein
LIVQICYSHGAALRRYLDELVLLEEGLEVLHLVHARADEDSDLYDKGRGRGAGR